MKTILMATYWNIMDKYLACWVELDKATFFEIMEFLDREEKMMYRESRWSRIKLKMQL